MFAVHREQPDPSLLHFGHDELTGNDQSLLVGQRDVFAGSNGGQRRCESGRADQRRHNHLYVMVAGCSTETFGAREDFDLGELRRQGVGVGTRSDRNQGGSVFDDLAAKHREIAARSERDHPKAIRVEVS